MDAPERAPYRTGPIVRVEKSLIERALCATHRERREGFCYPTFRNKGARRRAPEVCESLHEAHSTRLEGQFVF